MQSGSDAIPLGKATLNAHHAQCEHKRTECHVCLKAKLEDAACRALEETVRCLPLDVGQKDTDCHVAGPGDMGMHSPKRECVDVYMEPTMAPSVSSAAPPLHGTPDVHPGLRMPSWFTSLRDLAGLFPAPSNQAPPPIVSFRHIYKLTVGDIDTIAVDLHHNKKAAWLHAVLAMT